MKTTVLYHRADFDGLFCREIARKFLPDAELIGWDYGDLPVQMPAEGTVYVLDLSPDSLCDHPGLSGMVWNRLVWIDHHKSAIEKYPTQIPGYRIDGVAACRLAWQWFISEPGVKWFPGASCPLPIKQDFIDRKVTEPLAVRLAGEYDIWDKRDPRAELFQHGLRSKELTEYDWKWLLTIADSYKMGEYELATVHNTLNRLLKSGEVLQYAQTQQNESIIKAAGFTIQFEGLTFLACNHARYNSFLFTAGLTPEHDGCFGFAWRDGKWNVSLYHAPGKEHHDLSLIAVKYGGGGHRGACGFRVDKLPFL